MQTLTFNKNSWHYTIAKFGGFDRYEDQDLCTYTRKFMRGVFLSILIGLVITVVGFGMWNFIFGIIFSIIAGAFVMTEVGAIFGSVVGALMLLAGFGAAVGKYKESREHRPTRPNGFVKNAYKGWKEKYCIKITVQE